MTTCPQARPVLFKTGSLALVLVLIISMLTINAAHAQVVTDTFHFTGAAQTWTVPPNVTTILVEAIGGDGGGSDTGYLGSAGIPSSPGGYVKADVAVSGGQVLNIYVGGGGTKYTPGWNGGGIAGTVVYAPIGIFGAGGGGASDIRIGDTTLYDRILVAGAGGGASYGTPPAVGGSGGGLVGGNGKTNLHFDTPGGGGTQSAGGIAGSGFGGVAPGSFGVGGGSGTYHTAGGGGGWYGGGSGSGIASAGGGSSYTDSTLCSNVVHRQGDINSIADGAIYITYCNASIYQQPLDTITCDGGTAYFAVTTSGSGLAFQWQMNTGSGWNDIVGGGSRSLSFNATSAMNGARFRMRMLSPCNADTIYSNVATLTVNSAPSVTVQPVSSTICENTNTSFSIMATGTGLMYQWQVNTGSGWTNLSNIGIYSGASTDSLVLTGATSSNNGYQYRCVVSGTCTPVVMSNAAGLTIQTTPVITGQPVNKTICNGNNTYYKVSARGAGLTYQWQVNTGSGWSNVANTGIYSGATTDSLVLTGVTASNNGYQYRAIVSGTCGPSATSNAASLTIDVAPAITSNPTNSVICEHTNTSFSVTATGTGITYQWQVNTGTGWNNLTNTGIYSGATTATLSLTGATTAENGYQYRAVVSGTCTPDATSSAASLTIQTAPVITAQPVNRTICSGDNTTFGVTATGTNLTYQWQVNTGSGWNNISNGGIYSNATTSMLTLTGATTAQNNYQYRVVVSGTCSPSATSNAGSLTIDTAPVITSQPINSTICDGGNTSFAITATGTNLTYQWQVNTGSGWTNLTNTGIYSGATTAMLSLTAATTNNNGYQYRVVVSGTCSPSATSVSATLTVNSLPSISISPIDKTICDGGNTSYTVTATGTGISYQWQVNSGSGWTNLSNTGIYSGSTTGSLVLTAATTAQNGYQYRVVVSGTCSPSATSSAASLTIDTAPALTSQPINRTICSGGNTSFATTATGTNLTYQWQVNTGSGWNNISNGGIYSNATTATLSLTGASTSNNGYQYRCVVSGTCNPSVTSVAATLTVNSLPSISVNPIDKTICDGGNTSYTVTATGTGIGYQWQVNTGSGWNNISNGGIYSNATTATLSLTGVSTSNNGYQYRCVVSGICNPSVTSVAATLTVNSLPSISISPIGKTICDGGNTSYTVTATGTGISYQWQVNSGSGWNNINNGGVYSGATTSLLTLTGASTSYDGYQYRVVVSGTCTPHATSSAASLTVHPIVTPTVGITSSATTICATTSVTFTVSSSSNGGNNPSYQWKVNGNNVGSNSTTYTTTSLSNGDVVTCVMTTTAPCPTSTTATSNGITMTVNPLLMPSISISSATGDSVCATRLATFTASITNGGNAPIYQWKINGNNVGTSSATYTTNSLSNGDVVSCELSSNALCATPNVVNSNNIKMRVIPLSYATANIRATPQTAICEGDKVVVYCYYTNGGTNPKFEWYLNGNLLANKLGSYTTTSLQNNDEIYCIYTNGNVCPETVKTNTEVMIVNQTQSSSVNITASSGNVIAPGWTVTFTAQPRNGGANPTYKWRKNGQFVQGATSATYTDSDLHFGDKIDVVMKVDWPCKDKEYVISNTLLVNIPTGTGKVQMGSQAISLYPNPNNRVFMVKGNIGKSEGQAKVYIINSMGQKVYTGVVEVRSGAVEQQLSLPQNISAGMYLLSIEIDGVSVQKRFSILE